MTPAVESPKRAALDAKIAKLRQAIFQHLRYIGDVSIALPQIHNRSDEDDWNDNLSQIAPFRPSGTYQGKYESTDYAAPEDRPRLFRVRLGCEWFQVWLHSYRVV